MARRRALLAPADAKSEGARLLRELLARQTFGAIARRLRCDESAVRFYAREKRSPNRVMRERMFDQLGIAYDAWDDQPSSDLYAGEDPATTRRT